jgi:hypothetical protein
LNFRFTEFYEVRTTVAECSEMEANQRTDMELWTVAAEVSELLKLKARWTEEDERNRALYKHLWHNVMGDCRT